MTGSTIRSTLLAVGALLCGTLTAQAQPCGPCPSAAPPCNTVTKKIMVTEYKQEPYDATRTVYKTVWKDEEYIAYKCEMVPTEHTYKVTFCKRVPVEKEVDVVRYECVPVDEERKVTRFVVKCVPVQKEVTRCVDAGGHYECREVPCEAPRRGLLHRLCHKDDCESECVPVKVVSVYVPHMVTVKDKVTVMERVCEPVTETVKCTTYKTIAHPDKVTVTTYEMKTETKDETCTVFVPKTTPYPAKRKVALCTPSTETFTAYRCVPVQVEREVTYTVAAPCGDCGDCGCETHSHGHHRGGLFHRGCR